MRARVAFALLAASLAVAAAAARRRPAPRGPVPDDAARHVRGAVHVHTDLSHDSRVPLAEVVDAAAAAQLDFVVITDHNTDAAAAQAGYHRGVLVVAGLEKSTDAGHALVLGASPLRFRLDGDPASVAADAALLGAFAVIAHPTRADDESAWSGPLAGFAGLEVVSLADRRAWAASPFVLLRHAADPVGALASAYRHHDDALVLWDAALRARPLAGMLGSDAHGGIRAGRLFLPLPSNAALFRFASQHLLLAEAPARTRGDERLVLDALRRGRGYLAFDGLADASGFRFSGRAGAHEARMGEDLPLDGPARLQAGGRVPAGTTFVLKRDGAEVARAAGALDVTVGTPGTYRVEASLLDGHYPGRPFPWIVSNPIHVYPPSRLAERAGRAAPPAEAAREAEGPMSPIDGFEQPLAEEWQVDRAPGAWAALGLEEGSLRFDYRLGSDALTHASFCDWRRRDLSGRRAVRLRLRAHDVHRIDLQVRVEEPAAPGGVRIFRRSLRVSPEWRELDVPLASLETYDHRPGGPRLDRVVGLYLHVDAAHRPPGSRGTLWLDHVGLVP